MTVDFKIIASRERQAMAETLRDALGLTDADIVYDDRPGGGNPYIPTRQAWLLPHADGVTHRVVLNEDVEICTRFREICEQMAAAHPEAAFSLFTMKYDDDYYSEFISSLTTPYVAHDRTLWGAGILMPLNIVQECFRYCDLVFDPETVHESYAILSYLMRKGVQILTTIPETIQHIGDDSLYDPDLPIRRTIRYEKEPAADWTKTEVATPPPVAWFQPKPKEAQENPLQILKILLGESD